MLSFQSGFQIIYIYIYMYNVHEKYNVPVLIDRRKEGGGGKNIVLAIKKIDP